MNRQMIQKMWQAQDYASDMVLADVLEDTDRPHDAKLWRQCANWVKEMTELVYDSISLCNTPPFKAIRCYNNLYYRARTNKSTVRVHCVSVVRTLILRRCTLERQANYLRRSLIAFFGETEGREAILATQHYFFSKEMRLLRFFLAKEDLSRPFLPKSESQLQEASNG
jgi:hypothetical protein